MRPAFRFKAALLGNSAMIVAMLAGAPVALAQDGAGGAPSSSGLEDIIVTAERREQRLQDVPIAATILSANEMARRGVTNVADIQQVAPSIAINTVNRSTFINIRGVGIAQSAPTSNPGIAYYIDGQLIPHEQFIGQSFYDIDTIEVLRGPQGTLSGQNSTGGAIYVRTPEPKYNELSGYIEQTVGEYDHFRTVAALNFSTSDTVAIRIAGMHEQRDSFSTNIGPSRSTPGNFNLDAARINIALRTSDERLRVNVRGEFFDYKTDNIPVKPRGDQNPALRDPAQPAPDPRQVADPFVIREDAVSFLDQRGYRLSAEARYAISDAIELRAMTAWQNGYTHDQTDGDRGTAPSVPANLPTTGANAARYPGRVSFGETDFRTWISEVNLLSTGKGPFNWVVGAFRMAENVPVTLLRDNRSQVDFVRSNSTFITNAKNTSESLFGQANWFVTDQLELLLGARYSWDEQVYTRFDIPGAPTLPFVSSTNSTALTGKVGINYHFDNGPLVYVTASRGYKAGGVNLTPFTPNFKPERNLVYEAGIKSELLDRHLRVNANLFYSDYKDIQLNSLFNGVPQVQNAASGESWGAELEVMAQFGGLNFSFGAGYLDAKFASGACINDTNNGAGDRLLCPVGATATSADAFVPKGRVLPLSPEWTLNAGLQYTVDLGNDWAITPRIQWSYVSSQVATPFPSVYTDVPGRHIADARITLEAGQRYRLELYAQNLFDKVYIASQIQNTSSATGGYIYGAPRQFGAKGTVKF